MKTNLLLLTDVYKMGHMEQYPPGTTKVYSYLCARKDTKYSEMVFYGLQYFLERYLSQPITVGDAKEFLEYRRKILGDHASNDVVRKIKALGELGYLPLQIKAVEEGTVLAPKNALMTITNTHPDFAWVVGFVESLLLKVWNTCTVATYSRELKKICTKYADETCDSFEHTAFQVHDFGYRGCSSEETAALGGSAHLLNFLGTDTVPALKLIQEYYGPASEPVGLSVPATEHSVMCAYGYEGEFEAFKRMLDIYPSHAIVSIVSDTYDLWNVLTNFAPRLKERILERSGKVVFRPDSGNQLDIICGNPEGATEAERKGVLQLLGDTFGYTLNKKGFKVLNPKVGLIYGDGFTKERFESVLCRMKKDGWASSNLVVGIGGLLLQQHTRDDLGFAIKATYAEIDGKKLELFKDPVTDTGKKSHRGLMCLVADTNEGTYKTFDRVSKEEEQEWGQLQTVFYDGNITLRTTFDQIRKRVRGVS